MGLDSQVSQVSQVSVLVGYPFHNAPIELPF